MTDIMLSAFVGLHLARAVAVVAAIILHPIAILGAIIWLASGGEPSPSPIYFVWAAIGCYGAVFVTTLGIEHIVRR